jgi:hypothetical protein
MRPFPERLSALRVGVAVALLFLPRLAPGQSAASTKPAAGSPTEPASAPKKPRPAPKDPFTPAQRRELERLLSAEREALEKEKVALAADRKALEEEKAALEAARRPDAEKDARIETLTRTLEEQRARLDVLEQSLPALVQPPQELVERLAQLEEEAKRKPELPPDAVSAGDFPGSIRIPGTATTMKVGGRVWVSAVSTLDALGSDDRFLTYSIPVRGDPGAEKGPRTSLWANPSRLNFDVRTRVTEKRALRAFIEGDFAGPSNGFRLRHAYMQYGGFLFGQTWSTFSDPDADPEDIDFEGLNAENVQRQAQVRYTRQLGRTFRLAAAFEYPNASLTDVDGSVVKGVNQAPDLVVRGTWKTSPRSHVQVAAVLRSIRAESAARPHEVERAAGWGLSVSGVASPLPFLTRDRFIFQANGGSGIARFINDLNSAGGQDGAFDPENGQLELLGHWGWYGSFEHTWSGEAGKVGHVRSSLLWGSVYVLNLDFQPAGAYRRTNRFGLNVLWNVLPGTDLGMQLIQGRRINKDGAEGTARQIQVRARYYF